MLTLIPRKSLNGAYLKPAVLLMSALFLWVGLALFSMDQAMAYESIEQEQDTTSLQIPMEILRRSLTDSPEGDVSNYFKPLEREWFLRKRYVAVGNKKAGEALTERLYEQMVDLGAINLRSYTASLLREASILSKLGNFDEAVALCKSASEFSPGLPEPHGALAKIYWSQNKLNIPGVLSEWAKAVHAILGSLEHLMLLIIYLNLLALAALLIYFGVFYGVSLIRNYRLFSHDLYEMLPGTPHRFWVGLTALLFLIIPLLFGLGFYVLCLFWVLIFWSYDSKKEKIVHLLFLLFTAAVSLWVGTLHQGMALLFSDRVQAVLEHQDGVSDDSSISRLVQLTELHPGDDSLFFMLGTAYKKRGDYDAASEVFQRALSLNPNRAIYYNNLGNVYYALRDFVKSEDMYERATRLDPGRASFYYNLSAIHREQFLLNQSEEDYSKAYELDPELISRYVEILGPGFNRMVIDETLTKGWLWRLVSRELFSLSRKDGEGGSLLLTTAGDWGPVLALLLAVLLIHYVRQSFVGIARCCVKCGAITCRKCQTDIRQDSICSQCVHVFEDHSGVDARQRTKKIIDIRRQKLHQRETVRLAGILVPGGGHIYLGQVFTGFLIIFLITACLVFVFIGNLAFLAPVTYRVSGWSSRAWILVPALLIYGFSLRHLYRLRG